MAQKDLKVTSEGILRGIPTFDASIKGLTAVVTGANGISGNAMVEWLAGHPQRWSTIHAISRRPPAAKLSNVTYHAIDLLNANASDLAQTLKEKAIDADYLFHFAYTDSSAASDSKAGALWAETDSLVKNNSHMFEVVIVALSENARKHKSRKLKAVMLQTGTKHYGFHLGPILAPGTESDPIIDYEANFYWAQEKILKKYAKEYDYTWNVVRPSFIVGCPQEVNSLNAGLAYALYLAICKEMGQEAVEFPGTYTNYYDYCDQSWDTMNACLEEWAVLTPGAANEDFNVQDGDVWSWSRHWPRMAAYFGLKAKPLTGDEPNELETKVRQPSPRNGTESTLKNRIVMSKWATQPEVKDAWLRLQKKHNLQPNVFEKTWWPLLDFLFGIQWACSMSMSKAREFGFFGCCDSFEAHLDMFKKAEERKILPPGSAA